MKNKHLSHFGQIDISTLEEYYEVKTELNAKMISIDLNFKSRNISEEQLEFIEKFIVNIPSFDKKNITHIKNDFADEEGQVKEYLSFHLEEFGDDLLDQLNIDRDSINIELQLLSKLNLVRVGVYPDGKYDTEYFAVFDYIINKDLSDEIIVVKTDNKGDLDHIAWES